MSSNLGKREKSTTNQDENHLQGIPLPPIEKPGSSALKIDSIDERSNKHARFDEGGPTTPGGTIHPYNDSMTLFDLLTLKPQLRSKIMSVIGIIQGKYPKYSKQYLYGRSVAYIRSIVRSIPGYRQAWLFPIFPAIKTIIIDGQVYDFTIPEDFTQTIIEKRDAQKEMKAETEYGGGRWSIEYAGENGRNSIYKFCSFDGVCTFIAVAGGIALASYFGSSRGGKKKTRKHSKRKTHKKSKSHKKTKHHKNKKHSRGFTHKKH